MDENKVSFLIDGYKNFGWELDENLANDKKTLQLKPNRKIINKTELTRLQRNFEGCINEIEKLEIAKTSAATIYALVLGMIGTGFMTAFVFAVTAEPPHVFLCVLLAFPGFAVWITLYFVYQRIAAKRTEQLKPIIETKYEEIYKICENGDRLLNG